MTSSAFRAWGDALLLAYKEVGVYQTMPPHLMHEDLNMVDVLVDAAVQLHDGGGSY